MSASALCDISLCSGTRAAAAQILSMQSIDSPGFGKWIHIGMIVKVCVYLGKHGERSKDVSRGGERGEQLTAKTLRASRLTAKIDKVSVTIHPNSKGNYERGASSP